MPSKKTLIEQDIKNLDTQMKSRDFRIITANEGLRTVKNLSLQPMSRKKNAKNLPARRYVFTSGDYSVKSGTTWVDGYQAGPNEQDSGKVVVVHNPTDTMVHKEIIHRTKNFCNSMYNVSWGWRDVIVSLPVCKDPNCLNVFILKPVDDHYGKLPVAVCPRQGEAGHIDDKPKNILDIINGGNHRYELKIREKRRIDYETKAVPKDGKKPGDRRKTGHWIKKNPASVTKGS